MRIAVCDDDAAVRALLAQMLDAYCAAHENKVFYEVFSSAEELLRDMRDKDFDVLLLDILMPGMSGLDAAKDIRSRNQTVEIIFLTSSPEFAVSSYNVRAYYYILKPIDQKKLIRLLDELLKKLFRPSESLHLKSPHSVVSIPFANIEAVEIMNKMLSLHLADGTVREFHASLSEYEAQFLARDEFIKVHRSYLVNLRQMQELTSNGFVSMSGKHIPVARNHYKHVRETYIRHLFADAEEV